MSIFANRGQWSDLILSGDHATIELKNHAKGKSGFRRAQISIQLPLKSITVQVDFLGERFFDDFSLFVIEDFLIGSAIAPVSRFCRDAKSAVKRNFWLREDFAEFRDQVLVAKDPVDDDFRAVAIGVSEIVDRKSAASEILIE